MVQKSDGGYSYDSTDMAAIYYRIFDLKCDRLIYITDIGQQLHFNLVFEAAKLAGWHVPPKTRVDHMGFGLVLGEDGKRIKTRAGVSEKLVRYPLLCRWTCWMKQLNKPTPRWRGALRTRLKIVFNPLNG